MKKPKENPEKVIIIPRPPRASNQEWVPVTPEDVATPAEADPAAQRVGPVAPVDPGCGPMHNQVEGPATGLAGVPSEEAAEDE